MRLTVFVLLALLPLGVARAAQPPDAVAAIGATLDALHDAAAQADGERYFGLFTADAIFLGTDISERWTIEEFRAYAAPFFARGRGWVYRPRERHVSLAALPCACVAWFDERLDSASYGTSRGTGVVLLQDGVWRVAQYSLSFPIPNDLAERMTGEIKAYEALPPSVGP